MLAENLVKAGLDTEVYATTANGKRGAACYSRRQGYGGWRTRNVFLKESPKITRPLFTGTFQNFYEKEAQSFSLIHIHAWWNLVSIFSCLIALKRNVPVLLSARGTLSPYSFQNKNIGVKWLLHHLLGKTLLEKCHVHATSKREADAVSSLFKPRSMAILPNFCEAT